MCCYAKFNTAAVHEALTSCTEVKLNYKVVLTCKTDGAEAKKSSTTSTADCAALRVLGHFKFSVCFVTLVFASLRDSEYIQYILSDPPEFPHHQIVPN